MSESRTSRSEAGFGLIEVMAAVMVLEIGAIGFAALQMRSMQVSGDSYYRTQAMAIAQDLAERMRANDDASATTVYLNAASWTGTPSTTSCITASCNPAAMAAFDVANVRTTAQTLLPQGLVNMEACIGSSRTCVYVAWDGLQPTSGTSGQCVNAAGIYADPPANRPALTCVMLEFQP